MGWPAAAPVGGAQVFGGLEGRGVGGLEGRGGLLGVLLPSVPGCRSGDEEERHVDQHRGACPVLPTAERRSAVDEVAGGPTQGAVVSANGPHVGARGALERGCCLTELLAGVGGGGLGEGVEHFPGRRDVRGDDAVVNAVEHQDRLPGGGGRGSPCGSGPGHSPQRSVIRGGFGHRVGRGRGGPAFSDAGQGQVRGEPRAGVEDRLVVLVAGRGRPCTRGGHRMGLRVSGLKSVEDGHRDGESRGSSGGPRRGRADPVRDQR